MHNENYMEFKDINGRVVILAIPSGYSIENYENDKQFSYQRDGINPDNSNDRIEIESPIDAGNLAIQLRKIADFIDLNKEDCWFQVSLYK